MTDEDEPKRPNEKYKLSKPDMSAGEAEEALKHEQLNFYYNREQRLKKAPQAVRDLYNNKSTGRRFNPFRPLIADKPRAILFFTILTICAMIYILSIIDRLGVSTYLLDGNRIEITGARFEGTTIIVLRKTLNNGRAPAYTGAVDIVISPIVSVIEGDLPVFFHRVFFSLQAVEEYRFAVPFDTPQQLITLQTENASVNIRFTPE